jgi:hypothetical protein
LSITSTAWPPHRHVRSLRHKSRLGFPRMAKAIKLSPRPGRARIKANETLAYVRLPPNSGATADIPGPALWARSRNRTPANEPRDRRAVVSGTNQSIVAVPATARRSVGVTPYQRLRFWGAR